MNASVIHAIYQIFTWRWIDLTFYPGNNNNYVVVALPLSKQRLPEVVLNGFQE